MTDKPHDEIQNQEEWDKAKEELDEMDMLMRIGFSLEQQNRLLQALVAELSGDTPEKEESHTCKGCDEEIPESDIESHARSCMNWGETLGDVEEFYK